MPTVPRRNDAALIEPSVRTAALPEIRLSPTANAETFGGGAPAEAVAQAARGLQNPINDMAATARNNADQLAVLEADKNLSALETRIQYDPKSGAMNKRGKDAFALPDQVRQDWDTGVSEIEKNLNNGPQKLAFRKMATSRWGSLDSNVQRHVSGEIKQYDSTTTESYLANERDAAAANYMDGTRVGLSIQRQQAALYDHAQRNGLPEEWVKLKATDATSKTHSAVITRMLNNDQDIQAKEYFTANKENLTGADVTVLEKSLEEGTLRGESQRQTDAIVAKTDNRSVALEEARQITDPKLRDEVERRVNQTFGERKAAEAEYRNDLYLQATNILDNSKGGTNARDAVPASMWSQLSLEQRNALENRAADPQNDDKAWLAFLDLSVPQMASVKLADFQTKYWANFDKAHRTRAEGMWNAAQEAQSKSAMDPKLSATLTFSDRVDDTLRKAKIIDPNTSKAKLSDTDVQRYAQFEMSAAHEVENFELTQLGGKRKATGEEMQKILDNMIVKKVFVDKSFQRDPERTAGTILADERDRAYVPVDKIPPQDRNSIENVLKSKNKAISEGKVSRAYAAFVLGDRRLFDAVIAE